MKIVQIVPHYVPAVGFGGALQVAHGLSKAFVRLGHEVIVCTTNQLDHVRDLDIEPDTLINVDGVKVYYDRISGLRYWGFSTQLWFRVCLEVENADIVLIHAHYQFANWTGAFLARRAQKPYVIFAHGSFTKNALQASKGWLKRIYLRVLEHNNLKRALFIAFNASEEIENSLYNQKGKVILNGIDPEDFKNMPPLGSFREKYPQLKNAIFFLFLGRLDVVQKGLDLLIPAFSRMLESNPNAHLILAGADDNNGVSFIQNLINIHNISSHVTLTGLLQAKDKFAALQDADIFLLPSRFEGLSIALLEAMYIGIPILTTDRVGLSNLIRKQESGFIVSPNVDAIYNALCKLGSSEIRSQLRNHAKELDLNNYTWDSIATNLIDEITTEINKQ